MIYGYYLKVSSSVDFILGNSYLPWIVPQGIRLGGPYYRKQISSMDTISSYPGSESMI